PHRSASWSDDEVIERWSAVYGIPALVHASQDTDAPAAVSLIKRCSAETLDQGHRARVGQSAGESGIAVSRGQVFRSHS
nr:hypothetical protein [Xanthomonadales bacterium]